MRRLLASPDTIFARMITERGFARMGGTQDRESALRVCTHCQKTLEPYQTKFGYVPRSCVCAGANAAFGQQRAQQLRTELKHDSSMERSKPCYWWLGTGMEYNYTRLAKNSLEQWENNEQFPMRVIYRRVKNFIEAPAGTMLLYGNNGTGKTTWASSILNYLRSKGLMCRFTTGEDIFSAINDRHQFPEDLQRIRERLIGADVLCVDDAETARPTESQWKEEFFFKVIDKRYVAGRPTILTTNLEIDDEFSQLVPILGPKCVSRLRENMLSIQMYGQDRRTVQPLWRPGPALS